MGELGTSIWSAEPVQRFLGAAHGLLLEYGVNAAGEFVSDDTYCAVVVLAAVAAGIDRDVEGRGDAVFETGLAERRAGTVRRGPRDTLPRVVSRGAGAAAEESCSASEGAVGALTKHRRYIGIPKMMALGARLPGVAGRMLELSGGYE